MSESFIVICPHCADQILIEKLNCKIFRHGVFKVNYTQVPPHSSKLKCEEFIKNDLILGCCKPFLINDKKEAVICDYI